MAQVICDICGKQREQVMCVDCYNSVVDDASALSREHAELQEHCNQLEDEIQKLKGGSDGDKD